MADRVLFLSRRALVGFAIMVSPQAAFSMATIDLYTTFSDYNLTTIPLFVLMGQVAFNAGIARRLFNASYKFIGHIPGGMAMATPQLNVSASENATTAVLDSLEA